MPIYIIFILLIWIMIAFFGAAIYDKKPFAGFILGFLLGPLGLFISYAFDRQEKHAEMMNDLQLIQKHEYQRLSIEKSILNTLTDISSRLGA